MTATTTRITTDDATNDAREAARRGREHAATVGGRLVFIDALRGLAAPLVMIGHYLVIFFSRPEIVANFLFAEPIEAVVYPDSLEYLFHRVNLPSVGVAVFFIISGFVIPMSLEKDNWLAYVAKRILRIYPTLFVVLTITFFMLHFSAYYWGKTIYHTWDVWLENYLLIADWYGKYDILSVAWTLQIEIKFYVMALVFYYFLSRGMVWGLVVWALVIPAVYIIGTKHCVADLHSCWARQANWFKAFGGGAMYVTFMLIGTTYYAHFRGVVGTARAIALVALFFASLLVSFRFSVLYDGNMFDMNPFDGNLYISNLPYFNGIWIFLIFYLLRDRIHSNAIIRFFAGVSYPLYLFHALNGYFVMRMSIHYGMPYAPAFFLAVGFSIFCAWLIHVWVEQPSIDLGKRLGKKLNAVRT